MMYLRRQRFPVGPGYETALRLTIGSQPVWIDAICIDQSNDVKKEHQVLFLDCIYCGADEVLTC